MSVWPAASTGMSAPPESGRSPTAAPWALRSRMQRSATARRQRGKLAARATSARQLSAIQEASLGRSTSGEAAETSATPGVPASSGASTLVSTTTAQGTPTREKARATPAAAPEVPATTMARSQSGFTRRTAPSRTRPTWTSPEAVSGMRASRSAQARSSGAPSSSSMATRTHERRRASLARAPSATSRTRETGMSEKRTTRLAP